jgi:protocatechuate 3,4-dioxygenase beta subunit
MVLLGAVLLVAAIAAPPRPAAAAETIVGLPCEGCEAVFVGRPASLSWESRLAPPGLAGEPLILDGTVRDRRDRPVAGLIVYAYQTNADGVYPPDDRTRRTAAANHGSLRAWAKTDARGR